jgi:hypothetical protein
MSSLENVKPGIRPRFLSQKIDANDPEKKIPSTAAKAMRRSANVEFLSAIQRRAHSAFALIQGTMFVNDKVLQGNYTGFDCIKEVGALTRFFNIGVNQERVGFRMDVLHHDLEAIETSGLGNLYFIAKPLEKVLVYDTIRGSKEGKDVRNEKFLILIEAMFPIV